MRRGILAAIGSRIVRFEFLPCPRKPIGMQPDAETIAARVRERRIVDVERLGKRVLLRLDDEARLVFEPRMTGLVLTRDPPSLEHLRVRLDLADGPLREIFYWDRRGLGKVYLRSQAELAAWQATEPLGPDALTISAAVLKARLGESGREIKVALLDQKALAGVGNLYAAETLFRAGISPLTPCRRLRRKHWEALADSIRDVLETAVRYEGSTLSDGTYRNAVGQAGNYRNEHRVYDKEGLPCPTCGTAILRIVQAQRATFYCATCQPKMK